MSTAAAAKFGGGTYVDAGAAAGMGEGDVDGETGRDCDGECGFDEVRLDRGRGLQAWGSSVRCSMARAAMSCCRNLE